MFSVISVIYFILHGLCHDLFYFLVCVFLINFISQVGVYISSRFFFIFQNDTQAFKLGEMLLFYNSKSTLQVAALVWAGDLPYLVATNSGST